MPRTPRWNNTDLDHGIRHVELSSWKYFDDFIRDEMLDYRAYVWRGQRKQSWLLESTLDRELKKRKRGDKKTLVSSHLSQFKKASRGRRGSNPPNLKNADDWWALGQHHGLFTPLLDWTDSPYVSAYFAYCKEARQSENRVIYGLNDHIPFHDHKNEKISFIRPMSDENPRLVSQCGLFTKNPVGTDIESWIKENYPADHMEIILIKITLPNRDRKLALRSLNRMNINHTSLFPDMYGSAKFCNMEFDIENY